MWWTFEIIFEGRHWFEVRVPADNEADAWSSVFRLYPGDNYDISLVFE